jgi:hypothetical protein
VTSAALRFDDSTEDGRQQAKQLAKERIEI